MCLTKLANCARVFGSIIFSRGENMAAKKAPGTQVTSDKSMKKTSKQTESTKKKSITKKGEGRYESRGRG
jgi:hypothetical protein